MPRAGDFEGDWHKAVPENWTWIIVGGILTIVWVGGIFLLLFPQFEKPDRPIPLGPALVLTGILAAVLSVALYREELTEVRFGADGLAVRSVLGGSCLRLGIKSKGSPSTNAPGRCSSASKAARLDGELGFLPTPRRSSSKRRTHDLFRDRRAGSTPRLCEGSASSARSFRAPPRLGTRCRRESHVVTVQSRRRRVTSGSGTRRPRPARRG